MMPYETQTTVLRQMEKARAHLYNVADACPDTASRTHCYQRARKLDRQIARERQLLRARGIDS